MANCIYAQKKLLALTLLSLLSYYPWFMIHIIQSDCNACKDQYRAVTCPHKGQERETLLHK
jgi:hypothetical protein